MNTVELFFTFTNEYGEQYQIFKQDGSGKYIYIIAGDETDWEPYFYNYKTKSMYKEFMLTTDEKEHIDDLIAPLYSR